MKIAVSGKGGVGKTTLVALLGHLYKEEGKRVLLVDADTNGNLASALGYKGVQITPISQMKLLIEERAGGAGSIFKLNPKVDDIPEEYSLNLKGIRLLVIGGIKRGGSGCACPQNTFLKNLMANLLLERDEVIILDMEAGIEHLGRATAKAVEAMIVVVEPGMRSINTALEVDRLAKDIGIEKIFVVGNKIRSPGDLGIIKEKIQLPILGCISYNDGLIKADLEGTAVFSEEKALQEVAKIKKKLSHTELHSK
ncbi:AAA family ATPase [bacterium]|nr:AAA family ATPase [bacterium]MBU1599138.1 AAA family ATPase [bacterium]MBU2461275.1 AAA family ATPase [bacterium]